MKNTILTYILAFIFCLLFIVGLPSWYFSANAFSVDNYIKEMQENGYGKMVLDAVYKRFDDFGDEIAFEADSIFNLINKEEVIKHSEKYTRAYLEAVLNNKDFSNETAPKYDMSYAKDDLDKLLLDFYETGEGEFSEKESEELFKRIENELNSAIKFLPQNIMDKTIPMGKYVLTAQKVLDIAKFSLIIAFLLLIGIVILNIKEGIGKIIYKTSATVFIPSAILFIPFFLFSNYNVGEKVVLMKSLLSVAFSSVVNVLFDGFTILTGVLFILSFILIIVGAILTVLKLEKKGTKND